MGLRSLRLDGVEDSLNTLLPTCVTIPNLVIWSIYERNFGDPLRSRLSKALKVITIDSVRSPTYYREEIRGLMSYVHENA